MLNLVLTGAAKPTGRANPRYGHQLARRTSERTLDSVSGNPLPHEITEQTVRWIAPWDARRYPGRQRVVIAALGRWVTPHALNHWRRQCGIHLPSWAARAWADAIELRCQVGMRLVAGLRAHADAMDARPPRPSNLPQLRAAGRAGIGARGKMRDPQT